MVAVPVVSRVAVLPPLEEMLITVELELQVASLETLVPFPVATN
jgi:hypothetical protein